MVHFRFGCRIHVNQSLNYIFIAHNSFKIPSLVYFFFGFKGELYETNRIIKGLKQSLSTVVLSISNSEYSFFSTSIRQCFHIPSPPPPPPSQGCSGKLRSKLFKDVRVHAPITCIKLGIPIYFTDHSEFITVQC